MGILLFLHRNTRRLELETLGSLQSLSPNWNRPLYDERYSK